jgi:hypothetical protein
MRTKLIFGVLLAALAVPASASADAGTCSGTASSYTTAINGTAGLVSHWRLNDVSGSIACDETRRNPGTYGSGVLLQQLGATTDGDRATGFNGTTRVTVPSSAGLASGTGVSVEGWVKPSSTASQTVVRKDGQYLLRVAGGKIVARVWLSSGSYTELTTSAVVQTSAFQHVVMTYDGSALRVYRNGLQVASKRAPGAAQGSSRSLLIGSSDGYDGFTGTLDEIAVYSAALSGQTVASHWNAGRSATAPAPAPAPAPASTEGARVSCGWGTFSSTQHLWPSGCWRAYSDTSPFNKPVPAGAAVRSNSDAIITKLLSNGGGPGNLVAGGPDSGDYAHPVVYPNAGDPEYVIHCTRYACDDLEGKRVRIPVGAKPAGGTDGHLAVVDQSTGYEYDLYKATTPSGSGGTLDVGSGGISRADGTGLSVDLDGDGRVGAATAPMWGLTAGIVRAEELQAGQINHAVFITVPCGASSPTSVLPAAKGGTLCSDNTDRLPMGARLQLAMTEAEIDALPVPAWKKTILQAMRRYGMYFGDTGGPSSFGVMLESGATYTGFGVSNRMAEFAKANGWTAYNGYYVGKLKDGVPWNRVRVLDWSDPANR